MLGFSAPLDLPWQAAVVRNADISWMSVNSSKPGRADAFTMLVHSTNAWADAHIDDGANLAACGDWFLRGRVEAAFKSAQALAGKLRNRL